MYKAMINLREQKGFTLIELLIVVAIIGILAAIAIPGYLGMQERGRRGSVQRAVGAAEAEIQAWIQSAGRNPQLTEIDSNGDGIVNASDVTNSTVANWWAAANGLCSAYISARWRSNSEVSPWNAGSSLWVLGSGNSSGFITCYHGPSGPQLLLRAYDRNGGQLYNKTISSD